MRPALAHSPNQRQAPSTEAPIAARAHRNDRKGGYQDPLRRPGAALLRLPLSHAYATNRRRRLPPPRRALAVVPLGSRAIVLAPCLWILVVNRLSSRRALERSRRSD